MSLARVQYKAQSAYGDSTKNDHQSSRPDQIRQHTPVRERYAQSEDG